MRGDERVVLGVVNRPAAVTMTFSNVAVAGRGRLLHWNSIAIVVSPGTSPMTSCTGILS